MRLLVPVQRYAAVRLNSDAKHKVAAIKRRDANDLAIVVADHSRGILRVDHERIKGWEIKSPKWDT
jgi:hypothetical protein